MPSKTKKPVKKAAAAKKPVVKKKVTAAKAAVKPVKKPVAKKVAAKKPIAKKPVLKKVTAKKAPVKKAVVKKAVAKKVAEKKPVAKKVVKAPVKKVVKKAVAAKPVKKAVAKSTPKKAIAKAPLKTVQDNNKPKSVAAKEALKKPLATLDKSRVKTSATAREITPIKAPVPVVPKPRTVTDLKTDMNAITVPPDYEPTDTEEFMSPVMKEYFRQRLFAWRDELLRESEETLTTLSAEGNMQKPDITDRASEETDLAIEFRTRDRERKLLNKINEAIMRIEDNSYGYCEETGDAIPVKRLIARPTAVRTLEAEELHERRERTQRDQYE